MAQSNLRLAAGIGVAAAILLAGGPGAAVAIADGGGSYSGHPDKHDRSDSDNRDRSDSDNRDRSYSPGGSNWSDDNDYDDNNYGDNNIANRGSQAAISGDAPRTKVGSGRDSGTSDERPGSDYSPDPPGSFKSPKVTFGDGRSPRVQDTDPEPRWQGGAPEPAPPPPPPPPPATEVVDIAPVPRADRTPRPPVIRHLIVAPAAELTDPLWGVAGLLLIPAAGAVLGYRQARAAQSVAKSGRHP